MSKAATPRPSRKTGTYVRVPYGDEPFDAFVPAPLPPHPPLRLTAADHDLIEQANRALGRLDWRRARGSAGRRASAAPADVGASP